MEEVKILVYALVSFLSQDNIPIVATSAEIEINIGTKQISLHQYDIYSLEQYKDVAKAGLDTLMRIENVIDDLSPIFMTSKYIYVEDGKLNATLHLQYKDLKDLRKISIYADEEGNLSYPYLENYNYDLKTGSIDGRYVRFDVGEDIRFTMNQKEESPKEAYSLAKDWKVLEDEKFVMISEAFSKKYFEKVRKFIFKNGDRQTYRNFDSNNPHYKFENFDVYLGTGKQNYFKANKLKPKDYIELVIRDKGYYTVYLRTEESLNRTQTHLVEGKVYWHNRYHQDDKQLMKYLDEMKNAIIQKKP